MSGVVWQGRQVIDQQHVPQLEAEAAINEFSRGMSRQNAEHQAYQRYRRDRVLEAAAHHAQGLKTAMAAGQPDEAQRHGAMYVQNMRHLGLDPIGAIPEEVRSRMQAPDRQQLYRYKGHAADDFSAPPPVPVVAEKGEGRETPSLSKAEGWSTPDGLTIPKAGTSARARWDRAFLKALEGHFGPGRLIKVPVDSLIERNPVKNYDRFGMYQEMARHEGSLPPVVVRKSHHGYYLEDGNHRAKAAEKVGLSHVDAYEIGSGGDVVKSQIDDMLRRVYQVVDEALRKSKMEIDPQDPITSRVSLAKQGMGPAPTVQTTVQPSALQMSEEVAAAERYLTKSGINPDLCKVAPPGWSEEAIRSLKEKVGTSNAFKIAWHQHKSGKKKG